MTNGLSSILRRTGRKLGPVILAAAGFVAVAAVPGAAQAACGGQETCLYRLDDWSGGEFRELQVRLEAELLEECFAPYGIAYGDAGAIDTASGSDSGTGSTGSTTWRKCPSTGTAYRLSTPQRTKRMEPSSPKPPGT